MARPKKETVDYFPHSCNHKRTMFILEQAWGNNGYAFWFKLLEMLASTKYHFVDFNEDYNWEYLQAKTTLDAESCKSIMDLLSRIEAIDKELWENKIAWSQNFVDGIADVYRNRKVVIPERPSFYIKKPHTPVVSTPQNPQSKVKESKVKETNSDNFALFWEKYPRKIGKSDARKALLKINPDAILFEKILTSIDQAKKSLQWTKDGGEFIPHPATWLNKERWEDEIKDQASRGGAWD